MRLRAWHASAWFTNVSMTTIPALVTTKPPSRSSDGDSGRALYFRVVGQQSKGAVAEVLDDQPHEVGIPRLWRWLLADVCI